MKRIALVFISAFVLNVVWENLHSFLYANYKGGPITEFILMRASLFDAVIISVIAIPFLHVPFLRRRSWLLVIVGTVIAIVNEWYGLGTARWAYNAYMPVIPLINTGLTPTLQLGVLGFLSFKFEEYATFRRRDTMPE